MTKPQQPPEGELIARHRGARSVRAVAKSAGISEGRWRQLESGSSSAGRGQFVVQVAPADTLARMARVVGATSQELIDVGRPDAADVLERITPPVDISDMETSWFDELRDVPDEVLAAEVTRRLLGDHLGGENPIDDAIRIHGVLIPLLERRGTRLVSSLDERRSRAEGATMAAREGDLAESPAAVRQAEAGEENQDPEG